jgi:cell migration-inducing and hyaluronan-binding protein
MNVELDASTPPLNGLTINGKLSFANNKDVELTTEWVMVHGELEIGTEKAPHTRKATITFTNNVKDEDISGVGGTTDKVDRGIMLMGGTLNLHGENRTNTWTKLANTANAGSTSIQVLSAAAGGSATRLSSRPRISIPGRQSGEPFPPSAEIRSRSTRSWTTCTSARSPSTWMNVAKSACSHAISSFRHQADAEQSFYGGHVMAMGASKMFVEGVEFNRMGQNLTLARYPIHWHLIGDAQGQYIRNAAIHDTYNRCVTVHGTNFLHVENNVTYNTVGHCFFLEDGIEHGNEFVHNLAIQTKCHTSKPCVPTNLAASGEPRMGTNGQQSKDVLLPSDNTVASYWITNPDNTYRDNVAAGSDSNGFWMSLPDHPNGKFEGTEISAKTWPKRTPFREFKGNVAHSNYDSFMFDRNIAANNTFSVTGGSHTARENPADANSKALETVFEDLTAYKNRNGGIWGRGEQHVFRNVKLADNAMGYTHASGLGGGDPFTSRVVDSLFVGETENIGNPRTDAEKAYGRSLPKPTLPDFPIRGYEYYDLRHDVVNTTFRNYEDNATRKTGALSYLMFTSFAVTTNNSVERVKFVNAKPVYFPPMGGNAKWASDNGSSVAWKTAVNRDKDGSLGGGPNSYVVIDDGVIDSISVDTQDCERKPAWNASICKSDVGRLSVGGPGGGGRGGPGGGPGAAARWRPRRCSRCSRCWWSSRADLARQLLRVQALAAGRGAVLVPDLVPGAVVGGAGGGAPAQPPLILSRNGKTYDLAATTVRSGTEIKVATERPSVSLTLTELDPGSWVIFELPGFTTAASGTATDSLDALRKASATSYFKGNGSLWVKVVSVAGGGRGGGASLQVSR